MIAEVEKSTEEKVAGFKVALAALPDDKQQEWGELAKQADKGELAGDKAESAVSAFIDGLPPHLRQQFQQGLIDVSSIPLEELRRIANSAAVSGDTGMEFSGRSNEINPVNRSAMLEESQPQGIHHPDEVAVSPGPANPGIKPQVKTGPDLP